MERAEHTQAEYEVALIGAILVNNEAWHRVRGIVEPRHFCVPEHEEIFRAASIMIRCGLIATPVTVKPVLPDGAMIGDLTIKQYLAHCAAEATTVVEAAKVACTIVAKGLDWGGLCGQRLERYANAYLAMVHIARYRPGAPSDGFGNIQLDGSELDDPDRLQREAIEYACRFNKQENELTFHIGCSDFRTNQALIWTIEAARQLCCGGAGTETAIVLLRMALRQARAVAAQDLKAQASWALDKHAKTLRRTTLAELEKYFATTHREDDGSSR